MAVPLHKRPMFTGTLGAVFGISSVMAPLVGGGFTQNPQTTWRWCFYMNLPIGGFTIVIIGLILNVPNLKENALPFREKLKQLDPIGTVFFLPSIICLLLALQWGGSTYPWSDGRIIALLVVFGVLFIAFVIVQIIRQENATVPPRIFKQRSILAGMAFTVCTGGAMMIFIYFLAVWFQSIQGCTPVESGIRSLAMVISLVVASMSSGFLITAIGYYTPFMIAGSVLMSIGAGLLITLTPDISEGKWIGYQILFGFGLGMGMQQANLAAQTVLSRADVPVGASLMVFAQTLGGAVFLSVGQNLLSNKLVEGFSNIPGLDPAIVISTGATELRNAVPQNLLPLVLDIYNDALTNVFKVGLALSCATIIGSLLMEWRNIKKGKQKPVTKSAA
jgi:MFS family permease